MKLECTVTKVSNSGDTVSITLRGNSPHDAEWRPRYQQEIEVACSDKIKRAFYLGRKVVVMVEPR